MGWLTDLGNNISDSKVGDFALTNLLPGYANSRAASAQERSADRAKTEVERSYEEGMGYLNPYMEVGGRGLAGLEAGINSGAYDMESRQFQQPDAFQDAGFSFDFEADPGYQFRVEQGNKAIENSAAARGGLFSGGTGRSLADYNQGLATQEYGNAYNRARGSYESDRNFGRGMYEADRNFAYGDFSDSFNRDRQGLLDKYSKQAGLADMGQQSAVYGMQGAVAHGGNMAEMIAQQGNAEASKRQSTHLPSQIADVGGGIFSMFGG